MKKAFAAALGLVLGVTEYGLFASDWPMLGHDPARSGATVDEVRPPFARKWYRLFPDEGIQSGVQPILADGKVFLGTLRGILHAMNADTGTDTWTFRAGGPILHAAAAAEAKVVFGSADGGVYGIAAGDGKLLWRFQTGAAVWNAPVIHHGIVYIGSRDGNLYALDVRNGKERWQAILGAPVLNSPAIDGKRGRIYVAGEDMRVRGFQLQTGRELWSSEALPGASMRGYHPVIAPDGSVLVTSAPVPGYDRFQELLLDMTKVVFGDFASWRHTKPENDRLREDNFKKLEKPETCSIQLDYLRKRLTEEPSFQTFFVLDPDNGKQRFVTPIVASESMNGPGAPPIVTPDGRVIVKFQALLRSRYEHYSPFLNVGSLDTATGSISPLLDESRTYGWHDSLLLVHDEQSQLSVGGKILFNTHQDNVNALDLTTLQGYPNPLAINVHEPSPGQALGIRLAAWRGDRLPPGDEWLIRGTAVYGGGSVLDTAVTIAGDSFYYLPTHELNSGCALIAYQSRPEASAPKRSPLTEARMTPQEWSKVQELPWDWDTLAHPRLTNLLEALPGFVPGTAASPLTEQARSRVAEIPDSELDEILWYERSDNLGKARDNVGNSFLVKKLESAVQELLQQQWRPLVVPAAKAPAEAYRFFTDPYETAYTLLVAHPFLGASMQKRIEASVASLFQEGIGRNYSESGGAPREPYQIQPKLMRIRNELERDELGRLYPVWLWSKRADGLAFVKRNWGTLRPNLNIQGGRTDVDCGNSRLAGLIAFCRLAKASGDEDSLAKAVPLTRIAMRNRLEYEFAHTRGGAIRMLPVDRAVFVRWRFLTPEVGTLISRYALKTEQNLVHTYVDYLRPGWWIAWNVEQMMRNEAPYQLPSTALDIFSARSLILNEPAQRLESLLDLPWCKADEFYIQKIALALSAHRS